jgi:hypothetical protein
MTVEQRWSRLAALRLSARSAGTLSRRLAAKKEESVFQASRGNASFLFAKI